MPNLLLEKRTQRDIVKSIKLIPMYSKKYPERLLNISKRYKDEPIWIVSDLEKIFKCDLNVMPFFRPEIFIPGTDWNGLGQGDMRKYFEKVNNCHYEDKTITYVTASGLKKMLLILRLGEKVS